MYRLLILYFALVTGPSPSATVSWEEVRSIHDQNVSAARLRVQWELSRRDTEGKAKYHLEMADVFEQQSRNPKFSEQQRSLFRLNVGYNRKNFIPFTDRREVFRQDFWSDRSNFQIRKEPIGSQGLIVKFPDSMATTDKLTSEFSRIEVISFGAEAKQLFRIWRGDSVGGMESASVAKKYPVERLFFPPFGHFEKSWPGRELTIDTFWNDDAITSEVLGEVDLDGHRCVVVRRTWPPLVLSADDRAGSAMIAWIDLVRGAIPLRVERYRRAANAKPVSPSPNLSAATLKRPPYPWLVARQIRVENVTPDFAYPVAGIEEEMGAAHSDWEGPISEVTPHVIYEWKTIKVDTAQDMTKANFALQFPNSTVFFNEPTNDIRVTTDASGTAELLVQGARRLVAPPTWSAAIVQFGGFAACLIAVVWLIRNRFARSS